MEIYQEFVSDGNIRWIACLQVLHDHRATLTCTSVWLEVQQQYTELNEVAACSDRAIWEVETICSEVVFVKLKYLESLTSSGICISLWAVVHA